MNNENVSRDFKGPRRGFKRSLVRAKISQDHDRVLNEERDSNGVYEDKMVYVKNQPITRRSRGRPRKSVDKNSTQSPALSIQSEIVFLPPVRSEKPIVLPKTSPQKKNLEPGTSTQALLQKALKKKPVLTGLQHVFTPNSQTVTATKSPNSFNQSLVRPKPLVQIGILQNLPQRSKRQTQKVQPQTTYRSNLSSLLGSNLNPQSVLKSNQTRSASSSQSPLEVLPRTGTKSTIKSDWPADLNDLWESWDQLQELDVEQWVKYLTMDLPPPLHTSKCDDETRWQLIDELIRDEASNEPSPKVVVESEPNINNYGYSAMMNWP